MRGNVTFSGTKSSSLYFCSNDLLHGRMKQAGICTGCTLGQCRTVSDLDTSAVLCLGSSSYREGMYRARKKADGGMQHAREFVVS
jgi:hypothetical protein